MSNVLFWILRTAGRAGSFLFRTAARNGSGSLCRHDPTASQPATNAFLLRISSSAVRNLLLAGLAVGWASAFGAESNSPPAIAVKAEDTNSQETLRSYLQLQEQLHATQLAIERTRQETDAAAARNAETLAARLEAIEQSLAVQRARELEAMQSSNRVMLLVAGTFAAIGSLAMLLTALFQWRTIHRFAEVATALSATRPLAPLPSVAALGPGHAPLITEGAAEQSNLRLLGAIDRLEHRLDELEHAAHPSSTNGSAGPSGSDAPPIESDGEPEPVAPAHSTPGSRLALLLGKGQSLLNLDQPEEALACFDQVLGIEANHAEALVRKGLALERLRKLNEAIECYDRAIAADGSLTIAYLYKAGLFNRQERFGEALACYDQALRTQAKPGAGVMRDA